MLHVIIWSFHVVNVTVHCVAEFVVPFSSRSLAFMLSWKSYEITSSKGWKDFHLSENYDVDNLRGREREPKKKGTRNSAPSLIEFFLSDLTFKQQSSKIYCSTGTLVLILNRPEYSEVALECLQSGRSGNFVAFNVKSDQRISITVVP